jgi:hypothetical protein
MFEFGDFAPQAFGTAGMFPALDIAPVKLNPFDSSSFWTLNGGGSTLMPASQWPGEGSAISGNLTGLAKSAASIFGAAAPILFASDTPQATPVAAYRPAGGATVGGFDLITVGLLAVGALAAWYLVAK